jgi:hypothetical protein
MGRAIYDHWLYWENQLLKHDKNWKLLYSETSMTEESCFLHLFFMRENKKELDYWVMLPNEYAAIGFLKYIFLPITFKDWLFRELGYGLFPPDGVPMETVFQLLEQKGHTKALSDFALMRNHLARLDTIWDMPDDEIYAEIADLGRDIFGSYADDVHTLFYFNLLRTPEEVSDDVVSCYKYTLNDDLFEEQMGLTIEEWKNVTAQVNDSEFMKRRFVDILNNRLDF